MQRARPCATGAWHSRCLVDLLRRVLGESVPARREGARAERGMAQDERAARERDARNCGPAAAPVDRERAHEAGGRQPFPQADRLVEQRERFRVAPAARRRKDRSDEHSDDEEEGLDEERQQSHGCADDTVVGSIVREVGAHALVEVLGPQEALKELVPRFLRSEDRIHIVCDDAAVLDLPFPPCRQQNRRGAVHVAARRLQRLPAFGG
mmetsp:Transcript_32477/g.85782  ORF Transcript_32477/g.85782 Transcript_32477/m.85782 type:complete len:209 (+) Transcript_32477:189-815(+)